MSLLQAPRLKLGRAKEERDLLYDLLVKAIDPKKHPVTGDIQVKAEVKPAGVLDPRPWLRFTLVASEVPKFGPAIALLMGEMLHNYRGALDHTAWLLVRHRGQKRLSRKQARLVQFPMARGKVDFWNRRERLPGVPDRPYRTLIERYQPYRRSADGRAMRWLRTLTDTDKHRFILPAVTLPQQGNLTMSFEGAQLVATFASFKPGAESKRGTQIMGVILAGGEVGKRKVGVQGSIVSQPIFPKSLLPPLPTLTSIAIEEAINQIDRACTQVLDEIEGHM